MFMFITTYVCKEDPLVLCDDDMRAHGLLHRLRLVEYGRFHQLISRQGAWNTQCQAANISCGKMFSIIPGERGVCTVIIHEPLCGPFILKK